ncbi:MAG: hypothetical protein Q9216_006536 [Gyalolechia sp. 2 TL-2023]
MDIIPPWQQWVVLEDLERIYPLSHSASRLQPSDLAKSFAFEKLPQELQLNILHFAMPRHGFRPLPLPSDFNKIDPSCIEYIEALRREQSTVRNLFRVNQWVMSESKKIFQAKTALHIDVEPSGFRYGSCQISKSDKFRCHSFLQHQEAFTSMRNYELQIHLIEPQHSREMGNLRLFSDLCYAVKEWLRMICDALSKNECINHMTVKMLGLCALQDLDPRIPFDPTPKIVDSCTPLTRLRVNKATIFSAHHHSRYRILYEPCFHPAGPSCQDWIQGIQNMVGPLEGAPLSPDEETWKQLKCENRVQPSNGSGKHLSVATTRLFNRAWRRLNQSWSFQHVADSVREQMAQEYTDWQTNLRLARQCQYQKLGKDPEHPIVIDDDSPEPKKEELT